MNCVRAALFTVFLIPVTHLVSAENLTSIQEVRLTDIHGPVTVQTMDPKVTEAPPPAIPFALAEGDFVKTGSTATAEIALSGGSLIHLAADTAVRIRHLTTEHIEL